MENQTICMLIVEDEPHTREVLMHYIPWHQAGIGQVCEAADGRAGLELARQLLPDILLTDIRLPRMDGIALARRIREIRKDCMIIFLSAYTDREYLKSAIQIRAVSYVEKPINEAELLLAASTASQEVLSRRRYRQQLLYDLQTRLCLAYESGHIGPLEEEARAAGLPVLTGPFLTASVRLYPNESIPWPEYEEKALLSFLREKYLDDSCLFALRDPAHLLIYRQFTGPAQDAETQFAELLELLQEDLIRQFPQIHRVLAGIGSVAEHTDLLSRACAHAALARKRGFFSSGPVCFSAPGTGCFLFRDRDSCCSRALFALRQGSYQEIRLALLQLQHTLRQYNDTPPEQVRHYYIRLLLLLLRRQEERPGTVLSTLSASFVEALGQACCLDDLTETLSEAAECFFRQPLPSENSRLADRALRYIRENYADETLNIPRLAAQLYLSPGYLSLLFKKETGKTINQYLTETRISRARQLLADRSLSLHLIAQRTGYHDANYFSKVFKRETGFSPKAYREELKRA
ncbi:MAG: response regulator [Eubacteriales bacterium]|nr:response regulator [Eubacteriales bacterium]